MRKKLKYYLLFFALFFFIYSCQTKDPKIRREKAIQEKIAEKITNYRRARQESCQADLLKKAGKIVDSLLMVEARLRIDSESKPPKPEKPEKPEILLLRDSTEVSPFFRDSSLEINPSTSSGTDDRRGH